MGFLCSLARLSSLEAAEKPNPCLLILAPSKHWLYDTVNRKLKGSAHLHKKICQGCKFASSVEEVKIEGMNYKLHLTGAMAHDIV